MATDGAAVLAAFARDCKEAARGMRRLPPELRREMAARSRTDVAEPLSRRVAAAARGPWGDRLAGAVKTRVQADPQIVIGGARRVVSGGASARQLVYGAEFGTNGTRVALVNRELRRGRRRRGKVSAAERARMASAGRVIFKRRSTRQFVNNHHPFVFPTLRANVEWAFDRFGDIVDDVIGKELGHGR